MAFPNDYFPAVSGLRRAVPNSQLMDPDTTMSPDVYESAFAQNLAREVSARGLDASRLGPYLSDPLAGQRSEVDAQRASDLAAIRAGFTGGTVARGAAPDSYVSTPTISPTAQQAGAQRYAELQKTLAPIQEAQIRAAAGLAEEQERTRGASALEAQKETAARATREANTQELLNFLNRYQGTGPTDITLPGGGAVRYPSPAQSVQKFAPLPAGQEGVKVQGLIDQWNRLKYPAGSSLFHPLGDEERLLPPEVRAQRLQQIEGQLDLALPDWRRRFNMNQRIDMNQTPPAQPGGPPPPTTALTGKIRVQLGDGRKGTIDATEFDPTTMTRLP